MEEITDVDYRHAKRVYKEFFLKSIWRSWFVCSEWYILLADVFENFRNMCLKMYKLDPAYFF